MKYQVLFIISVLCFMAYLGNTVLNKGKEVLKNQDKQLEMMLKGDF